MKYVGVLIIICAWLAAVRVARHVAFRTGCSSRSKCVFAGFRCLRYAYKLRPENHGHGKSAEEYPDNVSASAPAKGWPAGRGGWLARPAAGYRSGT